jgi:serine/threonine-protein kinase
MADQLARMVAVLRDPPKPIGQAAPQLASWEPFFAKAIARNADERFQSAEEMAEQLRQVAQGTPARFVPEGLQTVALPMMPDLLQQHGVAPAPQSAVQSPAQSVAQPAAAPATQGSPAVPASAVHAPSPSTAAQPAASPTPPPGGPPAGAYPGGSTQVSEARPPGIPTLNSDVPPVHIVDAADPEPPALVWWGVVVVAMACLGAGVLIGYILGAG